MKHTLKIQYLSVTELAPYAGNARSHSTEQIAQIAKSMRAFGFMNPILIDAKNTLIAGHGRLMAAKQLGLEQVPAVRIEHLSEAEQRAYMLADNKISDNAGWDNSLLKVELEYLMSADIDFEVDLTGFSTPELNLIMAPANDEALEPQIPDTPSLDQTVSEIGDIWDLGRHRIACGDCRDTELVSRLMQGQQARMVITDPPYNVPITGHVCGLGKAQHAEFSMAAGEMSSAQFTEFLTTSIGTAAEHCQDGALLFVFMDWRHLPELQAAATQLNLTSLNLCIWVKSNGGMGSLYRSQHELVLVLKKGKASHINNVELGKNGRYRTNVWSYAGMNAFGQGRDQALSMHPTVKPTAMIADAIQDVSHHGELVLDFFLGSGTTLLAAQQCHRRCYGIELDPRYVDVALQRWIALTDEQPVHQATGQTFEQLRLSRLNPTTTEENHHG